MVVISFKWIMDYGLFRWGGGGGLFAYYTLHSIPYLSYSMEATEHESNTGIWLTQI